MVGNGFQRCPGDMGHRGASGQARDGASGIRIPVGRAQAGKGRHHHHATAVGHALGELLHLAAVFNGAQAVAQPLHHGAADKDAAFERKLWRAVGLRGAGGQQAVARGVELRAGVHQHEAAGAVGVFGHAGRKTGLAKQRALLVTGHAANVDGSAQHWGGGIAKMAGRGLHLGHQRTRNVQQVQQVLVPGIAVHIEQHGAAGVAHIGDVALPLGELPDQPGINRAKSQLAALGSGARTGHMVQQPLQLGGGEVGIDQQAGFLLDQRGMAIGPQLGANGLGAAVLPDQGVVDGLPGLAVPDDGGLALVGDPQAGDLAGADAGGLQGLLRGGQLRAPDLHRVVFHMAGARVDLRQLALRLGHDGALAVKHNGAGAGGALVQSEQIGHVSRPV